MTRDALLAVRGLSVDLPGESGWTRVLDDVSFEISAGEIVGLVGESGSGKTMTALAILQLLPSRNARVSGEIRFDGRDLLDVPTSELRAVRGRDIGMVFQDPSASLHPALRVGRQIAQVISAHRHVATDEARRRAVRLLREVRIPDPEQRAEMYPFELSGGLQQRVGMAAALAANPKLLLADEPTTALDVTIQAQILELLLAEQRQRQLAVLFVTHDLSLVRGLCARVLVMYAGQIVEDRPTDELLQSPRHPYTEALLRAVPHGARPGQRLSTIPPGGVVPVDQCRFAPRCGYRQPQCATATPPLIDDHGGRVRCIRADELTLTATDEPETGDVSSGLPPAGDEVLLSVAGLHREFTGRRRLRNPAPPAIAVDRIDLQIRAGETLALVGESGAGKSTTARLVLRLLEATGGRIDFAGRDITRLRGRRLRRLRSEVQAVFQDATGSLDPTMTVGEHLSVAVHLHRKLDRPAARRSASELLAQVGLDREHLDRYPLELSGGQRQRVGLARALAARPRLLVLDEPVSSLDVSTQSQAVNLLADVQRDLGLAYLLIAHDLPLVRHLSHRIAVMYLGAVVEDGPADQIYEAPRHPYTQALLSLVPTLGDRARTPIVLTGEVPGPTHVPSGCRFRTRCPYVFDACVEEPPATTFPDGGRVQCHLHTAGPRLEGGSVDLLLDDRGLPAAARHGDPAPTP